MKKSIKLAIVAAVAVMLGTGCVSTRYQNGEVQMTRNTDGSFQCGGSGVSSNNCGEVFDVLITEDIKQQRGTAEQRGEAAGNERFCRDYPEAKRCQGN